MSWPGGLEVYSGPDTRVSCSNALFSCICNQKHDDKALVVGAKVVISGGLHTIIVSKERKMQAMEEDLHVLSPAQERRLITYVEDKSLELTRAFQKRNMSSSALRTLPDYLNAIRPLIFNIIMAIPPIVPSGELRTSLLLRLTSDLLEAIPHYPAFIPINLDETEDESMSTSGNSVGSENGDIMKRYPLVDLFEILNDLDSAWATVLSCQVWNHETRTGEDVIIAAPSHTTPDVSMDGDESLPVEDAGKGIKLYAPSDTDCTRLRSMLVTGMSAIEDWLDEADAPDAARQPFEDLFEWSLRLLGEDSNEATWVDNGFVSCGA